MVQNETNKEGLEVLARQYNSGLLHIVRQNQFQMEAGAKNTYLTSRSALIIPCSGRAQFCFDRQVFLAERGRVIHGCPNHRLTIQTIGEEPFIYCAMYYDGKEDLLFSCELPHKDQVFALLEKETFTQGNSPFREQYQMVAYTEQLLDLLFADAILPSMRLEKRLLEQLTQYLHEHYQEKITLQNLADYAGESKNHISYLFYKYYRVRPIDYLIDYRMKQAVKSLRAGANVSQAAKCAGYSDALYFSRIFKRRLGFAPSTIKQEG